ncbi:MAG TPA: hypothetical protein VEC08_04940, partial [Nitrososphaerales archaeon]|nr:hypothetical protein [Nitrososphaerales archaeon]
HGHKWFQSSVAENVAGALKTRLLEETRELVEGRRPKNPDAYVEYLRGRYFGHKGASEAVTRKSNTVFRRST